MTTRTLKHLQLYDQLSEAIDFENAPALPLKPGVTTQIDIQGLNLDIQVEQYPPDYISYFRPGTILYNKFNDNYYNIGFGIDEAGIQVQKTDYKVLAKILGVVVRSTLQWVKQNKPDVLTLLPVGGTDREFSKKLSIYASILQKNQNLLDNLGYTWDYYKFRTGNGLYIAKKELFK